MAVWGWYAQKALVNDFVTGGHAEICFSLFATGLKQKKTQTNKDAYLDWKMTEQAATCLSSDDFCWAPRSTQDW